MAIREFDRFEAGARSAFIGSLRTLVTTREGQRPAGLDFKKVPDETLGAGITHSCRASKELRILLSRDKERGGFVVHHFVRRSNRNFYDSEF